MAFVEKMQGRVYRNDGGVALKRLRRISRKETRKFFMRISTALGVGLILPVLGVTGAMAYGSLGDIVRSLSARSPLAEATVPPVVNSDFVAASVMQWEQPASGAAPGPRLAQVQVAQLQSDRPAMEFLIGLALPRLTQPGTSQAAAQAPSAEQATTPAPVLSAQSAPAVQAPVTQAPVLQAQAAPQPFFILPKPRTTAQPQPQPRPRSQFQMPWQIGVFQ
jgi:hypothetical protein